MEPSSSLSMAQRASFAVGHVLNDLCASMWFSYLLLFLHNVVQFGNELAGYLMLLGQIVDALSTPFVGYESDRSAGCGNYGRRKTWHLVGTLCVACSFPFFFMQCLSCAKSPDIYKFAYFAPFVVIFQFGWASTQISHLSLIPDLASTEHERVELTSLRYAMTVISSIAIYAMAAGLFGFTRDSGELGPDDIDSFKILALIAVGVGGFFSVIFHIGTKENSRIVNASTPAPVANSDDGEPKDTEVIVCPPQGRVMLWHQWLKEIQFYQMAGVYMCTRLIVNVSQIYIPMYLVHSLKLEKIFIALVPLTVFITGFLTSLTMKVVNRCLGRKGSYFLGLMLIITSSIWFWCLQYLNEHLKAMVFGPAVLLGAGGSTILVTSLSMTADLIGDHTNSAAFVYGAMSFTDKLSNGVAVVLIQHLHPCKTDGPCCAACVWYYRDAMVFLPGGIAILAIFLLGSLIPQTIGRLSHDSEETSPDERTPLLNSDTPAVST